MEIISLLYVNKKMSYKVFLLFIGVVFGENLLEGDRCYKDGMEGVCRNLQKCQTALEDINHQRHPQICSFVVGKREPIVCCVENKPDSSSSAPEEKCEPLPDDLSPLKTGQKAYDKCIDYQLKYVYPCEEGVDLLGDVSRQSHCHHKTDELIIGGTDAERYEFPHMVLLGYGDLGALQWGCGGAIISERFILTAGHCIAIARNEPVTFVAIGILKRQEVADQSKIYKVKRIIPHPEYSPPIKYNDIALLETEKPMKLDQYTVPACLHTGDLVNDTKVIAAGWGQMHDKWRELSNNLQRIIVSKYSSQECSNKYTGHRHFAKGFDASSQLCYGDKDAPQWYPGSIEPENKDTCQGDSGGPIVIKDLKINCMYTIMGVTSIGKNCGYGDKPGLYTRVAHYLSWIEGVVWPN